MKTRNVYECDMCHKEFNEPSYNDGHMSVINFELIYNDGSIGNKSRTLGVNGNDIALCPKCTDKFLKMLKDFGFKYLNEGCSGCEI